MLRKNYKRREPPGAEDRSSPTRPTSATTQLRPTTASPSRPSLALFLYSSSSLIRNLIKNRIRPYIIFYKFLISLSLSYPIFAAFRHGSCSIQRQRREQDPQVNDPPSTTSYVTDRLAPNHCTLTGVIKKF